MRVSTEYPEVSYNVMPADYVKSDFSTISLTGGACTDRQIVAEVAVLGVLATDLTDDSDRKQKIAAEEFCNQRCPVDVREKCLRNGLANKQPGIYGGLGARARRRMAAQENRNALV